MDNQYIVIVLILFVAVFYNYCNVYKTTENFQIINPTNNMHLVLLFYSKKCEHSMDALPVWHRLKNAKSDTVDFFEISTDDNGDKNNHNQTQQMLEHLNVKQTPTLVHLLMPMEKYKSIFSSSGNKNSVLLNKYKLVKQNITSRKKYVGEHKIDNILKWLKLNNVFLKESYLENFSSVGDGDGNNNNKGPKTDIALRFGSSSNVCRDGSSLLDDSWDGSKKCYDAVFYKKSANNYCIDSKSQKGCINPYDTNIKPVDAAYNVVSSYLDTINLSDKNPIFHSDIINECALKYSDDLGEFGLCDNQQYLNDVKKYNSFTKDGKTTPRCKNTNYDKNTMYANAIAKSCREYNRSKEPTVA
jgi:hypothetical protein